MHIQCDCGKFKADVGETWKKSPGRLVCYCDDCQEFVSKLNRGGILDEFGGTETIPLYPNDIKVLSGLEQLRYIQLTDDGPIRISTICCDSPILNTRAKFPWAGVFNTALLAADENATSKLGNVKIRIMGQYALSPPPFKVSKKIKPKDMLAVMPFIIKGKLTGKHKTSAFFQEDRVTPAMPPLLQKAERR